MTVNIVGAGISGLSASITLAEAGIESRLISVQPSERAQSVLAEGGINGALDTMGEDDNTQNHFADTVRSGCGIADEAAVRGLTERAPEMIMWLSKIGVPFNMSGGKIQQRNFGGQKKKRTAYAMGSTGKAIMSALIDEARKYEARGLITRFSSHEFTELIIKDNNCVGAAVRNTAAGETSVLGGPVVLAFGGMNGVFPDMTTGTTANSGEALAKVFSQGVKLSNLEMIQYHPTTYGISGKRCLITEAARGEGGRLYIIRNNDNHSRYYFMEEKYPELKNLMPRDVVSREMYFVSHDEKNEPQVFLDMTVLSKETWNNKLPDLRKEIIHYMGKDPAKEPIPVEPGIHYFMGGIDVDAFHRTNINGLFAVGECCSQYHGANRLGGNSLLGACYSGRKVSEYITAHKDEFKSEADESFVSSEPFHSSPSVIYEIRDILLSGLGIVRDEGSICAALGKLSKMRENMSLSKGETARLTLAEAMLLSAKVRRESRGAHFRSDYPERNDDYKKLTEAEWKGELNVTFKE